MRVLVVTNLYPPHYLGGYELYCRDRVDDLRASGHDVRVLTSTFVAGPAKRAPDRDVFRELQLAEPSRSPFARRPRIASWRRERHNVRVLGQHIDEFQPDVLNWWNMGSLSSSLVEWGRRAGIPAVGVVCSEWLTHVRRMPKSGMKPRRGIQFLEQISGIALSVDISAAAKWLFISEYTRNRTLRAGIELQDTDVMYAGVDRRLFPTQPDQGWRWRILYLGRIDPRKGIDTLISALRLLPPEAVLEIIGSGDDAYAAVLRKMVTDYGLADQVSFADRIPQDQAKHAYARSDVLVCPFRWPEPSGGVLLEAMSSGTLVVATGAGGSGEYLHSEVDALLFEPGDIEGLAAQLLRLADNSELRRRLRDDGLRTASRFTREAWGRNLESALWLRAASACVGLSAIHLRDQ